MDPKNDLLTTIKELKDAIGKGDENKLKEKINWFHQDLKRNKDLLHDLYKSGNLCASQTDLILVACRNKQVDILYYILYETDILDHFPGTSFDEKEVKSQRMEAFKVAINWDAFPMVEMLYDYWSGDLHWIGHDINKIKTLGKLLEDIRDLCEAMLCNTEQLQIDIKSLITFNLFQQTLYSSISKITPENTVTMLVEMLQIYDVYSQVAKVRIPNPNKDLERTLTADLQDSSDYIKAQVYIKYEVYFRKLDLNVALLILENEYVLRGYIKQQLKVPQSYFMKNPGVVSLYEEIEYALYHFIYRTCEDWRLYLDAYRQLTREDHHTGIHKGKMNNNLTIQYDKDKLDYGAVLFLERKDYSKRLDDLKNILLEKYVISTNKKVLPDYNYLASTIMNDYYSLNKVVYYMKAIEDPNVNNVLMIERVLHVTGEMLKCTPDTKHLLDSTKSLLQIAISVETVKCLYKIRDFLSHAEKGQLSARIKQNITNKHVDIFDDIKKDLKNIKGIIVTVLVIIKLILDKSLLENGSRLLDERIKNLPKEALKHFDEIRRLYRIHGQDLMAESFLQQLIKKTGLKSPLLTETIWICMNKGNILSKIQSTKKSISKNLVTILPTYVRNIRQMLIHIVDNRKNVSLVNPQLLQWQLKELPDFPKKTDIKDRKNKVEKIQRTNKKADVKSLLETLNRINDFSDHWEAITRTLSFCFDECDQFPNKTSKRQIHLDTVTDILDDVEKKCGSTSSSKNVAKQLSFDGIEKLYDIIVKHDLTKIEREKLISCLISRVNLLKKTLHPQHNMLLEENLRRYKHNREFRLVLEMLLADIANVLVACKIESIMYKSGKLMREVNLRKVLNHGNLFLDVIGDVFDSYDLSIELLSKAIMFAEDGGSIKALFKLFFEEKVGYDTIKEEKLGKMNNVQKTIYKEFQRSPNWKAYVKLVLKPRVN